MAEQASETHSCAMIVGAYRMRPKTATPKNGEITQHCRGKSNVIAQQRMPAHCGNSLYIFLYLQLFLSGK
jgi:hypothetical protein